MDKGRRNRRGARPCEAGVRRVRSMESSCAPRWRGRTSEPGSSSVATPPSCLPLSSLSQLAKASLVYITTMTDSSHPPTYSKRRRTPSPPPPDPYALDGDDDDKPLYVPVKQRRTQLVSRLAAKGGGATAAAEKRRHDEEEDARLQQQRDDDDRARRKREAQTLLIEAQEVKRRKAIEGPLPLPSSLRGCHSLPGSLAPLLPADAAKTEQQKREEEEAHILLAQEAARKQLAGAEELAKGIVYTERMRSTSVAPPSPSM